MQINFKTLGIDEIIEILPYFERNTLLLSAYSAAFKVMWNRHYGLKFAEVENCVVFMEKYRGHIWFHYPMSKNDSGAEERAVDAVEDYCRSNGTRLNWASVPRHKLFPLVERYGADLNMKSYLRWRDYLYNASDFRDYPGRKFSGQRNHVNKFKKLYPDYKFCVLSSADGEEIRAFLKEYEGKQLAKGTVIAREEMDAVYRLVPLIDKLHMKAAAIRIDGKIEALAMGETCGQTLIVDVEKGMNYEGIYQVMAQEFARAFAGENILYINREDDAGDRGLRKSKLQYNPIARLDRYYLTPMRPIDSMSAVPHIHTERLEIGTFDEEGKIALYRLECDFESNKYWGYDWRDDYKDEHEPTPEYFLECKRQIFARREEVPMGIYLAGNLIGEVVLHNFSYRYDCEVGVRLLPEYRGNGYAREALIAAMDYAFFELNIDKVTAKCFKPNERSKNCLLSAGMRASGEDDAYFYFYKTAAL